MEIIEHREQDKILLFIPMYNCEKQIVRVLDSLNDEVMSYLNEVLVVDNGSTDNGIATVQDYLSSHQKMKITLVKNCENYNLGGSHKVAIKYAQFYHYDYIIVLHGDDQGRIADLLPYLKSGEYRNYDCLLGSRFMSGAQIKGYSKLRIFGNELFNFIYSLSAGQKIFDLGAGLNLYRVSIFADNYHWRCRDALTFNNEMVLKSVYLQHKIKFFPITWVESDQKSNVKAMRHSFMTLKIALSNFFGKKRFYLADHRVNKNLTYDYDVVQRNFAEHATTKKVHLIMPMAGNGSRFSQSGFHDPKPLITIQGKPFFYWSTMSMLKTQNVLDVTFVILQEHVDQFQIDQQILNYFPQAKIVILPQVLNGAVLTCLQGVMEIDDNYPIIFNDCDHAFQSTAFETFLQSDAAVDGGLLTFKSHENKYSYVKYDDNGAIIGTVEKSVVSDDAICGAYYFRSKDVFCRYAQRYLAHCPYQEFYLSGVFNAMCQDQKVIQKFATDFHLSFGTPQEYENVKTSHLFARIGG
ncbi:MAG: glycosyltransferase [Prevotella sp.]|nr:glycosyltransferase [Prevotella sp.]